jgi:hypothetical protein
MSYDLNFWQYEDESAAADHQAVYERLSDGEFVEGLGEIPVDEILGRITEVFSAIGWTTDDEETWEGESGAFQIDITPQFLRFDCYGMDGDDMNRLIDIGGEFGLPLYDPQISTRFGLNQAN